MQNFQEVIFMPYGTDLKNFRIWINPTFQKSRRIISINLEDVILVL